MMLLRDAHAGDEAFVSGLAPRFVEHGAADGHTPPEVIEGRAACCARRCGRARNATCS